MSIAILLLVYLSQILNAGLLRVVEYGYSANHHTTVPEQHASLNYHTALIDSGVCLCVWLHTCHQRVLLCSLTPISPGAACLL